MNPIALIMQQRGNQLLQPAGEVIQGPWPAVPLTPWQQGTKIVQDYLKQSLQHLQHTPYERALEQQRRDRMGIKP